MLASAGRDIIFKWNAGKRSSQGQNGGQADDHKVNGARGQSGAAKRSCKQWHFKRWGVWGWWQGRGRWRLAGKDLKTNMMLATHTHTPHCAHMSSLIQTQSADAHGVCVITFCVTFAFYCIPQGGSACSLSPLWAVAAAFQLNVFVIVFFLSASFCFHVARPLSATISVPWGAANVNAAQQMRKL